LAARPSNNSDCIYVLSEVGLVSSVGVLIYLTVLSTSIRDVLASLIRVD